MIGSGHHQAGVRSTYKHATPTMRAAMLAELAARWTQVVARAAVDVERMFTDAAGTRIVQQGSGGSGSSHARCGRGTVG